MKQIPSLEMKPILSQPLQPAVKQGSDRYDVFISHAGAQKHFALWVRSNIRVCGYRAFVDERDLQCGLRRV